MRAICTDDLIPLVAIRSSCVEEDELQVRVVLHIKTAQHIKVNGQRRKRVVDGVERANVEFVNVHSLPVPDSGTTTTTLRRD
jgi:hypothetical protein